MNPGQRVCRNERANHIRLANHLIEICHKRREQHSANYSAAETLEGKVLPPRIDSRRHSDRLIEEPLDVLGNPLHQEVQ
jgi:hypothetical protein